MNQTKLSVRRATDADVETIADFNCRLARETENKTLDRPTVTEGVRRGLQTGPEVTYFMAVIGQQSVGTLMLTREWSDWRNGWIAWLQSVFVVESHRGQGVFRSMLNQVLEEMESDPDVIGVRLYVENENIRAQNVYQRSGFADPNYKVLERLRESK